MGITTATKPFLGVGWSFPPCPAADGSTKVVSDDTDVSQAIWIILGTNWGERAMRPDFGGGLQEFVFAPISETMMRQVQARVQDALLKWEPRIDVESVVVTYNPADPGKLTISITYMVRSTNTRQNLVYPFFLQEGAGQ